MSKAPNMRVLTRPKWSAMVVRYSETRMSPPTMVLCSPVAYISSSPFRNRFSKNTTASIPVENILINRVRSSRQNYLECIQLQFNYS